MELSACRVYSGAQHGAAECLTRANASRQPGAQPRTDTTDSHPDRDHGARGSPDWVPRGWRAVGWREAGRGVASVGPGGRAGVHPAGQIATRSPFGFREILTVCLGSC